MLSIIYYGSIYMREMKHILSINYIVLVLGCLVGYLKSIWKIFCMHIQDENMFNNIIEVYDMEIVMNKRPFTATALIRLVHMISSTRVIL